MYFTCNKFCKMETVYGLRIQPTACKQRDGWGGMMEGADVSNCPLDMLSAINEGLSACSNRSGAIEKQTFSRNTMGEMILRHF